MIAFESEDSLKMRLRFAEGARGLLYKLRSLGFIDPQGVDVRGVGDMPGWNHNARMVIDCEGWSKT